VEILLTGDEICFRYDINKDGKIDSQEMGKIIKVSFNKDSLSRDLLCVFG